MHDMKHSTIYLRFAEKFVTYTIEQLVELFNREVGNHSWTSMRAAHDCALMNEFIRRGVNVVAVYDGQEISFERHINFDSNDNKIIPIY